MSGHWHVNDTTQSMLAIKNSKTPIVKKITYSILIVSAPHAIEMTSHCSEIPLQTLVVEIALTISSRSSSLPELVYVQTHISLRGQAVIDSKQPTF